LLESKFIDKSFVYFYVALAAVRVSSSYQCVLKHYAYTQTEYIKPTITQVDFPASQGKKVPQSQQAFFKEYNNNDFELVVKVHKQVKAVLDEKYEAGGVVGLGKISTTNL